MRQSTFNIAIVFVFLLLAGAGPLTAQTGSPVPHGRGHHGGQAVAAGPPVVVKASVDVQQIVIGQPFHLMLEVTVPGKAPLTWPILDSLAHFEFVEKGKIDSSITKPDEQFYRQYFTITSFDSGTWSIPRLPFTSGANTYFTDSIRVQVGYTKFDPNQDYHDIKDIIDIPNPYAKWIPWIIGAITLLSLVLVIWLVRKKKLLERLIRKVAAPRLSPYEEAISQLNELEKQGFAAEGSVKVLYTRLNDILRVFIFRRLGISSLAETNEELIGEIRRLPLNAAEFDELADTLRMSDFVKFAKYQPGLGDNERSYRVVRAIVERFEAIATERSAGAEPGSTAKGNDSQTKINTK